MGGCLSSDKEIIEAKKKIKSFLKIKEMSLKSASELFKEVYGDLIVQQAKYNSIISDILKKDSK